MSSDPMPRRVSRFGLILPFVLFLLLIALYSGFWMVVRGQFEKTVDDWIAAETAAGSVLEYSQKTIGGYPFRVALTLDDATYESADKSLRYEGEVTQLVMQPWNWRHIIARAPGRNLITGRDGIRHTVNLNGKSAGSVSWDRDGTIQRVGLMLDDADLLLNGRLYQTEALSVNLAPREGSADDMMVAVQWNKLTLEGPPRGAEWLGDSLQESRLIGEVRGFYPALAAARGDPARIIAALFEGGSEIEIAQGLLNWGPLKLGTTADIVLENGVANGSVGVRIDDAEALKTALKDAGRWTLTEQMIVTPIETSSVDGGFLVVSIIDNEVKLGGLTLFRLNAPRS